jgi:putative transposase
MRLSAPIIAVNACDLIPHGWNAHLSCWILCRKHGMSEASFYNWKAKYGGLEVCEAKRLKGLESENAKLNKLLADAMLDNAALKESPGKKMVTLAAEREAWLTCVRHERAAGVQGYRLRALPGKPQAPVPGLSRGAPHPPPHAPSQADRSNIRPEPPANGPHRNRPDCSEKQRQCRPEDQPTVAMGTAETA